MKEHELKSLAAADVLEVGTERYRVVHDAFDVGNISADEGARLRFVYDMVTRITRLSSFDQLWLSVDLAELRSNVGSLGKRAVGKKERKAYHDLRGGSIFCLTSLTQDEIEELFTFSEVRVLALDQAKLMRALFPFLDPEKANEEEAAIQVHTVSTFLKGWENRLIVGTKNRARVQVANTFEGAITCRCVETSALDRLLVNLTNNAVRFVAPETPIQLIVFQVSDTLCRFCVLNQVDQDQESWLADKMDDNGWVLFQAGVTRGSTGLGLGSSADIVGQAFGVTDSQRLVTRGYLGVTVKERTFCAWFHWPIYVPGAEDEYCECLEA